MGSKVFDEHAAEYDGWFLKNENVLRSDVALLERVGLRDFTFFLTLTRHPVYSNSSVEEPSEGYDRGDYVAIVAHAPSD